MPNRRWFTSRRQLVADLATAHERIHELEHQLVEWIEKAYLLGEQLDKTAAQSEEMQHRLAAQERMIRVLTAELDTLHSGGPVDRAIETPPPPTSLVSALARERERADKLAQLLHEAETALWDERRRRAQIEAQLREPTNGAEPATASTR